MHSTVELLRTYEENCLDKLVRFKNKLNGIRKNNQLIYLSLYIG